MIQAFKNNIVVVVDVLIAVAMDEERNSSKKQFEVWIL